MSKNGKILSDGAGKRYELGPESNATMPGQVNSTAPKELAEKMLRKWRVMEQLIR